MTYLIITLNILVFLVYAYDKDCARKNKWRIPEATLLTLAFFGGSLGAYTAMYMLRHKTCHKRFQILVPLFLALHIAIIFIITE